MTREPTFGIAELAERGGVSRRTVRYYVRRGLLPPPTGTGRGNHYTQVHLDTLVRIRQWQEAGVALADIHARLQGNGPVTAPSPVPRLPARQPWSRVAIADGIELHIADSRRLTDIELARVTDALRSALRAPAPLAPDMENPHE